MNHLKFKGTTASLVHAAELLVMNSEPMASRIYCSFEDYLTAGFGRFAPTCFAIRIKDLELYDRLQHFDNSPYVKFELVPDRHVIQGFVRI